MDYVNDKATKNSGKSNVELWKEMAGKRRIMPYRILTDNVFIKLVKGTLCL